MTKTTKTQQAILDAVAANGRHTVMLIEGKKSFGRRELRAAEQLVEQGRVKLVKDESDYSSLLLYRYYTVSK